MLETVIEFIRKGFVNSVVRSHLQLLRPSPRRDLTSLGTHTHSEVYTMGISYEATAQSSFLQSKFIRIFFKSDGIEIEDNYKLYQQYVLQPASHNLCTPNGIDYCLLAY